MNGIYDLNSSDDSAAWNAHEIRSHRAPKPRRHYRRVALVLAAVVAVGGVSPVSEGSTTPPVTTQAQMPASEPVRTVTISRSQRAVSARTAKINKVINYAMAQRGDKYKWGAAGPSKWDCSGLVMKSFGKVGRKLPHYTGGIQKKGIKVSKKNLKRGDIIFPQRGHVGIYLGGGKMIHASSGKGKIVVSKVYGFYTARRVL